LVWVSEKTPADGSAGASFVSILEYGLLLS